MKTTVFLVLMFLSVMSFSQELLCRININYQNLNLTNQQIINSLYKDLNEFINQKQWTNYVFGPNEKIECQMVINLTAFNGIDEFTGNLQVSYTRPVYDASLTTVVFNFIEPTQFKFKYIENSPIEFNENTFTSELAYTMAFYVYIILGYDFDTFSELGGTEFFQKAQKIVQNAQADALNKGLWRSMESRNENNRYWLANYLNSENFTDFRKAMYKYHRLGLDVMTTDITSGRNSVVEAIELIRKINQAKPNNILVNSFIESKRQEIINIFSQAPLPEITRVKQSLKLIDPLHASDYEKMGTRQ